MKTLQRISSRTLARINKTKKNLLYRFFFLKKQGFSPVLPKRIDGDGKKELWLWLKFFLFSREWVLSLFQFLKKRPWGNLVRNLTDSLPKSFIWLVTLYTLLLPILVVVMHFVEGINGLLATIVLNLVALVVFYYLSSFLRSKHQWLSLNEDYRQPLFSLVYRLVLKLGAIFAVIVFSYTAILLIMVLLEQTTGISQSQEIPDLTHMTFFDISYNAFTAGLTEEVWRLSAIVVLLLLFKKMTRGLWEKKSTQWFSLFGAFVLSSFVFGWLHTFGYSDSYFSVPITVQLGLIGMVFAGISLLTRRLWLAVFFHFFFDFVSFTMNAKAMHLLTSESAFEAFVETNMIWFTTGTYALFFFASMFFLSLYLIRFSKGGKKVRQKIASNE